VDWAFRARSRLLVDANPNSRENVMRRSLEGLLGLPCPKARPAFLRNSATNRCLELDAWCEALQGAAEFQGGQHARYPNPVHKSRTAFEAQVKRDALKQTLCTEHRVCLILVPHTVSRHQMASFLREELKGRRQGASGHAEPVDSSRSRTASESLDLQLSESGDPVSQTT
jgi:hypothetical protein